MACCTSCSSGQSCDSGKLKALSLEQLHMLKTKMETVASSKNISLETPTMTETTPSTTTTTDSKVMVNDGNAPTHVVKVESTSTGNPIVDAALDPNQGKPGPAAPKADGKDFDGGVREGGQELVPKVDTPGKDAPKGPSPEGSSETVPAEKYMDAIKAKEALQAELVGVQKKLGEAQTVMVAMSSEVAQKNMIIKALSDALVAYVPVTHKVTEIQKVASSLIKGYDGSKELTAQTPEVLLEYVTLSSKMMEFAAANNVNSGKIEGAGAVETTDKDVIKTKKTKEISFPGLTIKKNK